MPESKGTATAVIVTGGKQYRVAPGDKVLVGRLPDAAGTEITLDKVLMHSDGDDFKVGNPGIEGLSVTAKVVAHSRGPKVIAFRYKSKKNVRVHKGARADYTAIEIVAIGGKGVDAPAKPAAAEKKTTRAAARSQKDAGETPAVAEEPKE